MASYVLDVGAASRVVAELIGSQHDQRGYDSRTTTGREPGDNGDDPACRDVETTTTGRQPRSRKQQFVRLLLCRLCDGVKEREFAISLLGKRAEAPGLSRQPDQRFRAFSCAFQQP